MAKLPSMSGEFYVTIQSTPWSFFLDDIFVLCCHESVGEYYQIVAIVKGRMRYDEKDCNTGAGSAC